MEQTSNLSLFLYVNSLVLLAKDQNEEIIAGKIHYFNNILELKNIVETDILINASNTSGKLFVHNNHFCLVPTILFDPSVKSTYLNFSTPFDEEKQEVFYEGADNNTIQIVGAIEKEILAIMDDALPDLELAHGAGLILSYLFQWRGNMLGQELFVVAEQSHIYIAGFVREEMKIFNRFPVENDQEFLKYTFSVLHQLAFDRMHCKISLLGDISGIQVDPDVLKLYFKNLILAEPKSNHTYALGAEKIKETRLLEAFWTA